MFSLWCKQVDETLAESVTAGVGCVRRKANAVTDKTEEQIVAR
jgi:hypothetical protein